MSGGWGSKGFRMRLKYFVTTESSSGSRGSKTRKMRDVINGRPLIQFWIIENLILILLIRNNLFSKEKSELSAPKFGNIYQWDSEGGSSSSFLLIVEIAFSFDSEIITNECERKNAQKWFSTLPLFREKRAHSKTGWTKHLFRMKKILFSLCDFSGSQN